METWIVEAEQIKQRLDRFLETRVPMPSRSLLQACIKRGQVRVNDELVTVHHFLKEGDKVTFDPDAKPLVDAASSSASKKKLPKLKIIKETSDWMVIDKPIDLLVHPTAKSTEMTLVDLIIAHAPEIARVGEDPTRPGIVHRLDRDTSGLMVIAKSPCAYESLRHQFAQHSVHKTYLALVQGVMHQDQGEIKFRLSRSQSKGRMAAHPVESENGRAAWTYYKVLERLIGASLLELEIFSGRTHQIRTHLHALEHPVLGDRLYHTSRPLKRVVPSRLCLQSVGLTFEDPATGEPREFHLDPDPVFEEMLKGLRATS